VRRHWLRNSLRWPWPVCQHDGHSLDQRQDQLRLDGRSADQQCRPVSVVGGRQGLLPLPEEVFTLRGQRVRHGRRDLCGHVDGRPGGPERLPSQPGRPGHQDRRSWGDQLVPGVVYCHSHRRQMLRMLQEEDNVTRTTIS